MYESLNRHCKDFHLYVFAFNDECFSVLKSLYLANMTVISLPEFEDEELLKVKPTRSRGEYCWTCSSSTILYVLDNYDVDHCTYIDADLYFCASPQILLDEMDESESVLITPHRYTPQYDQSEKTGRGIYSFCMCPGGVVVAAASEENRLVSNGMSYHARDKANSNSALVVTVGPEDFEGTSVLRGMEFQRHYESLAYKVGGGGYKAPVQLLGDFVNGRKSTKLGAVIPSYEPGFEFADMRECLPSYVVDGIKEGVNNFDRKIKGYGREDAVLTGIETRTSAPVKITRNERLESISLSGLYPCGEGAGFAGGIVSAAVDGIKVAERIIEKYSAIQ